MPNIAVVQDGVVVNVIVADSAIIAQELFPNSSCVDVSEPVLVKMTNGVREFDMPAWVGIGWRLEDETWIPNFSTTLPNMDFDPDDDRTPQTPLST
jgi:hypothetical protein